MSNAKIMYLRDKKGIPCVTIAFRLDDNFTPEKPEIRFGYAVQCVGTDEWDRSVGRQKAEGRLNSHCENVLIAVSPEEAKTNAGQMNAIVRSILAADPTSIPTRMRRGAANWLKSSRKA